MDILIVVVLCFIGITLILVEIFLIPGLTITALAGGAFSIGGIYYAFRNLGPTAGIITLISALAIIGIAFVYLIKSKALDTIALKTDINSTVASNEFQGIFVGDEGISISRLNPMGKVRINNITMEAKTLGEFIDENTGIEVLKVSSTQLIVKSKDK
jgi:membrane-bound ClpP family serine protease